MRNFVALIVLLCVFSCKQEPKVAENKIKEDVSYLADDKLEGRQTGTKGEELAAEYLIERYKAIGLEPKGTEGYVQAFSFRPKTDPHKEVEFTTNEDGTITGRNVIGFIDNGAENTIIIGAHYDHLGYGGEGSLYREKEKSSSQWR